MAEFIQKGVKLGIVCNLIEVLISNSNLAKLEINETSKWMQGSYFIPNDLIVIISARLKLKLA